MILFVSAAMADVAAGQSTTQTTSIFTSLAPMIFFIGIIYFLLIKPQQKKAKQHKDLLAAIKKGDKVVTNSGIIGTVAKVVNDQEILIEIADKVFAKFVKSAVANIIVEKTEKIEEVSVNEEKADSVIEEKKGRKIKEKK